MNDSTEIKRLLESSKTIAVVGLSADSGRPSHAVARYMQLQGYRIVPVNPYHQAVLGESCYPSLLDIPDSTKVDLVNVFRRPSAVPLVVEQTIQIGVRAIWLQEGVVHGEAARRAASAGLTVVMDRCLLKEHSKYID
jgi:predicted CoA-binding protein